MPAYIKKTGGTWSNSISAFYIKSTTWRTVSAGYIKVAGAWRSFFTSVLTPSIASTVTISSNNSYYPSTLTGTNFSWSDSTSLTYVFQKSSDNSSWSNIGSATSIANPSSGSSNTVTYALTVSDFPAFASYFRFVVTAVNSTYSTSASSQSSSVIVYYGTPIPDATFPSITGSTTVGNTAYGNIGTWSYSPTSYDYRWFFMSGATSYPLTFSQARSVSNKTLSGFSATLVTSANHGYKANDTVIVSAMDTLFNGSHTITSKTDNTISFTLPTPTAFSITVSVSSGAFFSFNGSAYQAVSSLSASSAWTNAGTAYSIGDNVYYNSNRYQANSSLSGISAYNGGTIYSSGALVYSGSNRYQSTMNNNIGNSVTNYIYWTDLGSYAPGSNLMWTSVMPSNASFWTLQSFSNAVASGTTTAPNYYEGTVSSSTSISLTVPTTDYRSGLDMISKALYFGVKAYNLATPSPSEYSDYKLVYGVPVITLGTPTYPSGTQAQIPFTHVYMTKYSIDVVRAGASHTGYPTIITSSTSPINISGLTAGLTYTVNVYPINGEDTYGSLKTTSITLPNAPGVPTNLTRTTGNAGSKTFSWSAPSSGGTVVSYEYQLNSLGWIDNGLSTSVSLTGLSGSNVFQVRAVGSSLTGTAASTGSFTIPTINTGPTGGSITSSSATVSWTSSNQASYSLSVPGASGTPFTGTTATSSSLSLSSGTSYTPTLTITSSTGDTATTTGSAFTTSIAPPVNTVAPTIAPTSGTAGSTTYSVTSVGSWTNSPTGYTYLWQSSDNPPTNSIFITAPGSNTSSSYTPPSNFFTLGYSSPIRCRVIAFNADGNSVSPAFSNQASVSAPVSIPSGGTVTLSGSSTAGSVITASTSGWSGSPTSYDVFITTTTSGTPTSSSTRVSSSGGGSSTTYTITNNDAVAPANIFRAFATASNSGGTSATVQSSNIITATAAGGGGAAPVLISLTGNNSLAVGGTFSWSFSNSPTAYSLFVTGPSGTVYTTSNAYTYSTTTFRPGYDGTGWQGSGTYTVYVSAQNASGSSAVASLSTFMS